MRSFILFGLYLFLHHHATAQNSTYCWGNNQSAAERGIFTMLKHDGSTDCWMMGDANTVSSNNVDIKLYGLPNGNINNPLLLDSEGNPGNEYVNYGCMLEDHETMIVVGEYHDTGGNIDGFIASVKNDLIDTLFTVGTLNKTEAFTSVDATLDGGFIVGGFISDNFGSNDFYLAKYDATLTEEWYKKFSEPLNQTATAVVRLRNGYGYAVVGDYVKPDGKYAVRVIRTNTAGDVIFTTDIPTNYNGGSKNAMVDVDGNIVICGEMSTATTNFFDVYAAKVNVLNGSVMWDKTYPGSPVATDVAMRVIELNNGYYGLGGYGLNTAAGSADALLIIIDRDGNLLNQNWAGSNTSFDVVTDVAQLADGSFILTGRGTETSTGNVNYCLHRFGSVVGTQPLENEAFSANVFPNPASKGSSVNISTSQPIVRIELYNLLGELLLSTSDSSFTLPDGIAQGVYILKINEKPKLLIINY